MKIGDLVRWSWESEYWGVIIEIKQAPEDHKNRLLYNVAWSNGKIHSFFEAQDLVLVSSGSGQ
jgi:hypothetical protein